MLVYGDRVSHVEPRAIIETIRARLIALPPRCLGIVGHAALAAAFLEACELEQGVADRAFEEARIDAPSTMREACGALILGLAQALGRSWSEGFVSDHRGLWLQPLRAVETQLAHSGSIACKQAEGYAFYAVYPELYYEAAAALPASAPVEVIGLRSIGNGLAAMVAARCAAPAPITLRPFGPPFERRVAADEAFLARLRAAAQIAVADEGPGLSGSSFLGAAQLIEGLRKPFSSIHFFPSHAGELGAAADAGRRLKWSSAQRRIGDFDRHILSGSPARLAHWASDLTGPALRPLEDLSAGAWRGRLFAQERLWPPIYAQQERRKYILTGSEGGFLLKFAGLGATGERKLKLAQALHEQGFVAKPFGLRHGFLIEQWRDDARPLTAAERRSPDVLRHVADYLAFRDRALPATERGASVADLARMAARNVELALGQPPPGLALRLARVGALSPSLRPVMVDGRMHWWEWLRTRSGRILKTDALDHHAGHDLIGCQDIAWDLAAAFVELALCPGEEELLLRRFEAQARKRIDRESLVFHRICYSAFQLGLWHMASAAASDARETARIAAVRANYADDIVFSSARPDS